MCVITVTNLLEKVAKAVIILSMGCTETKNLFSLFFNFSFFGEKWGPKNEKSIYPDFGDFIGYFLQFFKVFLKKLGSYN